MDDCQATGWRAPVYGIPDFYISESQTLFRGATYFSKSCSFAH